MAIFTVTTNQKKKNFASKTFYFYFNNYNCDQREGERKQTNSYSDAYVAGGVPKQKQNK